MLQSKSIFYVGKLINIAFLHLKMNVLFSIAQCNHGISEKPNSLYMFMYMEINRSIQKKRLIFCAKENKGQSLLAYLLKFSLYQYCYNSYITYIKTKSFNNQLLRMWVRVSIKINEKRWCNQQTINIKSCHI